jgi:O-acetylserine/cysteine efflux transporter
MLCVAGLALIGWQATRAVSGSSGEAASVTGLGLALVLGAALCWAIGNGIVMRAPTVDMLAFTVWSSLFAVPPLALLSWAVEGWPRVQAGLASADAVVWAAVAWQAVGNTLFGYAAWGWLLSRHAASSVAPLALLVPVFGMLSSAVFLGEVMPGWKLGAAALVVAGLAVSMSGRRR